MQRKLSEQQVSQFHHDDFVLDQVSNFEQLVGKRAQPEVVVDIGGGMGSFALCLQAQRHGATVRVIDQDAESIRLCQSRGLSAAMGDALGPPIIGDETVICFNLILHHLISDTDAKNRQLQSQALQSWSTQKVLIFVNEYIYESPFRGTLAPFVIWVITSNKFLANIASYVARWVPSLRANTFGTGVRFRTEHDWRRLFLEAGYEVRGHIRGGEERISLARRCLSISSCRRDSFLLSRVLFRA